MKRYRISARHFRQNCDFPKGPFGISFEFVFTVWRVWPLSANSAIFAKIATFQRAPLPSHLNFCLVWRFWQLSAVSAIFANACIWIFVYSVTILAINRQFCHFRQNHHFTKGPFAISFELLFTVLRFWRLSANSAIFAKIATFQRAPLPSHLNFCLVWRFWQLSAVSAIFANACISGHISIIQWCTTSCIAF